MNIDNIIQELEEVIEKLKIKLLFLKTENKDLKKTIIKFKKYVKDINN